MKRFLRILSSSLFFVQSAWCLDVAVTVDDLPKIGLYSQKTGPSEAFEVMLSAFKTHKLKNVMGFLNAHWLDKQDSQKLFDSAVKEWVAAGHLLGNHTYRHLDYSKTETYEYLEDIQKNEAALEKFSIKKDSWRWFRAPNNSWGQNPTRVAALKDFLIKNRYQMAPFSIFFYDNRFNDAWVRCKENKQLPEMTLIENKYIDAALAALRHSDATVQNVHKREAKLILVLHITELTAHMMDRLLAAYKNHGVKFISLEEAVQDPLHKDAEKLESLIGFSAKGAAELARICDLGYNHPR